MVFKLFKNTSTTGFYVYGIGGIVFSIAFGALNMSRLAIPTVWIDFIVTIILLAILLVVSIGLIITPIVFGFKVEKMYNKDLYMDKTCTATCGRKIV